MNDGILLLIVRITLLGLTVTVARDYLQRRDRRGFDVLVMFLTLAVPTVTGWIAPDPATAPRALAVLGSATLMMHPWALIRLIEHFRPVPRAIAVTSAAVTAVGVVLILVLPPPLPPVLALPLSLYYIVAEVWATWALVSGARSARGVSRWRLGTAAGGSFALALVIAVAVALIDDPSAGQEGPIATVLASISLMLALGYLAAFAPPSWLRQAWQVGELRRLLQVGAGAEPVERATIVEAELLRAAMRAVGALGGLIALDDGGTTVGLPVRRTERLSDPPDVWSNEHGVTARARLAGAAVLEVDRTGWSLQESVTADSVGAHGVAVVPFLRHGQGSGKLVLFLPRASLFPDSDLALLTLFAEHYASARAVADAFEEQTALLDQLRTLNVELARASHHKSEFLANMSHELRTPLNAIIGFTQLLVDGTAGPVAEAHREFLVDILDSGKHLLRMINDILDLAKVEAGRLEFRAEPVHVERLVASVASTISPLAQEKSIALTFEVEPAIDEVIIDPARLRQILFNYLSNAVKFTPEGGMVTVRGVAEGEDEFRLTVEDSGPGISEDDLARLFQEFEQLDSSRSKRHAGTGLGLALTRRLAEAQGGRVVVASTLGEGSSFGVVLPKLPSGWETSDSGHVKPRPEFNESVVSILVVEDVVAEQRVLRAALEAEGFAVDVAGTGREAIAKASRRRYAAVTLDLLLPDLDGWQILESIRATPGHASIPVIVVTVVDGARTGGFAIADVLSKPVKSSQLVASLERAGVSPSGRVLVVDDDPSARKLARGALEAAGFQVDTAEGAVAAMARVEQGGLAAIVLDLMMPDVDGFEFLGRLRAAGSTLPVVVWTARELSDTEKAELRAASETVLVKHGETLDLTDAVRACLAP